VGFSIGSRRCPFAMRLIKQHVIDPDAVPSSLSADGLAYLWLDVMVSVDVPEVSSRRPKR
jgi:hypothetical protein